MGMRVRAFDWEKSPLGPISRWPQSLKTIIDLMMASQLAMNLLWGPERIQIYNDANRAFMGTKHPHAFGRPGREGWGEVWEEAEAIHQRVFAGETVTLEDHPWTLLRNGSPEEAFFTSYFTPVRDETGAVVANLATAFETTNAVKEKAERDRAERDLRESEARLAQELEGARQLQQVSLELLSNGPELLYEQILNAAMAVMRSQAASMQISEPGTGILKLLAWRGFHPDAAAFWDRVDCNSASTCGEALKTGRRILVSDTETCAFMAGTEDLVAYRLSNLRAVQSTPLRSRYGRALGMVSTHWREPHEPSKDDFSRFDVLARQAADLIERAQTEAALRESEARLKAAVDLVELARYSWNPQTNELDWDEKCRALLGHPASPKTPAHLVPLHLSLL